MSIFRKIRRNNRGLRYKLVIAFGIMSVIPLLACTYLISLQTFPDLKSIINTCVIVVISIAPGISFANNANRSKMAIFNGFWLEICLPYAVNKFLVAQDIFPCIIT